MHRQVSLTAPLLEVTRLASITFWSLAFSWTDKPWFFTEGKFASILIIPSSWGSQLDGEITSTPCRITLIFWRCCRGRRRLLQGEFRTHILYFVFSFSLLYFYLFHFIKNTKNLVSLLVVTLLLLAHYVVC
jgi:hypothetical protein